MIVAKVYTTVRKNRRVFSMRYNKDWAVAGKWETGEYDGMEYISYTPVTQDQPSGEWLEWNKPK